MKPLTHALIGAGFVVLTASGAALASQPNAQQDYIRYVFTYNYEPGMDTAYQAYSRTEQQIEHRLTQDIRTQALTGLYEVASDELYAAANNEPDFTLARAD